MSSYYEKFVEIFKRLVSDLHRYVPQPGTKSILENYQHLNYPLVINNYCRVVKPVEDLVESKNEEVFQKKLQLLPGLDVSTVWPKLNEKQRLKIWTYLKMLLMLGELAASSEDAQKAFMMATPAVAKTTKSSGPPVTPIVTPAATLQEQRAAAASNNDGSEIYRDSADFNPYAGIDSSNDGKAFGIENMMSGSLPPTEEGEGDGGMGMPDMSKLGSDLKNMTDQDIGDATSSLKEMFGGSDGKSNDLLDNMIDNITSELRSDEFTQSDNPFMEIKRIAEKIAGNLQDSASAEEISDLVNSTSNIAKQQAAETGGPDPMAMMANMMGAGGAGMNPMAMMANMMGQQPPEPPKKK